MTKSLNERLAEAFKLAEWDIVPDDRVPAAEVADKEKPLNAEVAGYRAYLGKDK